MAKKDSATVATHDSHGNLTGSQATRGKHPSESSKIPGNPESLTADMTPQEINAAYERYMSVTEKEALAESRREAVEALLQKRLERSKEDQENTLKATVKFLTEEFGAELASRGCNPREIRVAIEVAFEQFSNDGHEPIVPENYREIIDIIKGYANNLVADPIYLSYLVYEDGVTETEFKRNTVQQLVEEIGEDLFSLGFSENTWRAVITNAYAKFFDENGKPKPKDIGVIKDYILDMITDTATHTFPEESTFEKIDHAYCQLVEYGVTRDEMEGAIPLDTLNEALAMLEQAKFSRQGSLGPGHNEFGTYDADQDTRLATDAFGLLGLPDGESYLKATKFLGELQWVSPF